MRRTRHIKTTHTTLLRILSDKSSLVLALAFLLYIAPLCLFDRYQQQASSQAECWLLFKLPCFGLVDNSYSRILHLENFRSRSFSTIFGRQWGSYYQLFQLPVSENENSYSDCKIKLEYLTVIVPSPIRIHYRLFFYR